MPFLVFAACLAFPIARVGAAPPAADWAKMFAAAPQREYWRQLDACLNQVSGLFLPQGASLPELKNFAAMSCDRYESNLTGEAVRIFGYARGNSAVENYKNSIFASWEKRISARDRLPAGVFARTPDGWLIKRTEDGKCIAMLSKDDLGDVKSVMLFAKDGMMSLNFIEIGPELDVSMFSDGQRFKNVSLRLFKGSNPESTSPVLDVLIATKWTEPNRGLAFEASVTESDLAALNDFNAIGFKVDLWPRNYVIKGVGLALRSLNECTVAAKSNQPTK